MTVFATPRAVLDAVGADQHWLDGDLDGMAVLNLQFHLVAEATGYRVFRDITERLLLNLAR